MLLVFWQISGDPGLTLFSWQVHLPLGVLLLSAFLLGAFVVYIVSIISALRDRRELQRLRRRVEVLEQAALLTTPSGRLQNSPPVPPIPPIVPMPGMPGISSGSGPLRTP